MRKRFGEILNGCLFWTLRIVSAEAIMREWEEATSVLQSLTPLGLVGEVAMEDTERRQTRRGHPSSCFPSLLYEMEV